MVTLQPTERQRCFNSVCLAVSTAAKASVSQGCSGHCSCSVRGILSLAGRAGRCEQLLRQESHSSRPCLWINSSAELAGGKALPCSLGVFLKAQGLSGLHQLRGRAKEVTSLFEARTSFTASVLQLWFLYLC